MEFRVLGSLAAVADGAVVELGPPKQRALLAVLLLHVGEIVPVDRLIELLWGEGAPRTAPHSVQIYVSELRKALEPVGGTGLIVTRPPGYVLDADRQSIDAWKFERLVEDGARMLESGDAERGRATLRQAMELWRGPALSDFAYEEFAQPYIRRLTDVHLDAVEILAAAELEAGRPADAIGLLATGIREDPLRERSRELLMLALYRAGRHADALRTFEQLRTQLADELGIDPSPRIRGLYDRILLHDPALLPAAAERTAAAQARNPFKGLRPFTEADAADFFGRDGLVDQLVAFLAGGARLVTLVGPSGSGKSSVVAAGLLPALRGGAVPGSTGWRVASMVPGANPRRELERFVASGLDLLVIDQFEAVFSVADEDARDAFLESLAATVRDPAQRLRVILTLRADYYDRPLLHPTFAAAFTPSVVNVVPMTADELEEAIVQPARRVGVTVESALLAELVADTADRPGSLPLLQFALAELFERRTEATLTRAAFTRLGGLRGLLSRQAERIYGGLAASAKAATTQVFLRLVRVGRGGSDSRRRVPVSELSDLGLDPVVLSEVLAAFGQHRLLTFDRDPETDQAAVEVAHEALLVEWDRLAGWIERYRADLRRHAALLAGAEEWEQSGRNPDYLFTGSRLQEFEPWLSGGALQLSGRERAFLEGAVERRREAEREDAARRDDVRRREGRATRRFITIAVAVFVLGGGASYALLAGGGPARPGVAYLGGDDVVSKVIEEGFDRGVSEFELLSHKTEIHDPSGFEAALRELSATEPALVVISQPGPELDSVAADFPGTAYLDFTFPSKAPNVKSAMFREWQGAFLAGVAAARKTQTGSIGFVGGLDLPPIWGFQAGFEAGAQEVSPSIRVNSVYLEAPDQNGNWTGIGFSDPTLAESAARRLYASDVDIIFQAAGEAGVGVFDAAVAMSGERQYKLWAIGVDSDQYVTVTQLAGVTKADLWREHILTSMLKRFDVAVEQALQDVAAGKPLPSQQVFDLDSGMVDISYSGGFIDDLRAELDRYRQEIMSHGIELSCIPDDRMDRVREQAAAWSMTPEQLIGATCP